MPKGWDCYTLGDLIDIKHGFAFKGIYFHEDPRGDILLTPGNFAVGGGFKSDRLKYYDGPVPEEYVLNERDLLVTMTDLSKQSDTLGYPAFVPASSDRFFLHNQRLGKISIKDNKTTDSRFLYYILCSSSYRHEVLASATGTTVKHTSPDRIKRHALLLPPLPEQRAIAHILGTLDDKIELNRRMNETLEGMARALFKFWFVDFGPVRAKMEGRWRRGESLPGMPAELYDLFPDGMVDSELGEIPAGWEVVSLPEIMDFREGPGIRHWQYTNSPIGTRFINIRCIQNGDLQLGTANRIRTEEADGKYSHFHLKEWDIVVSTSGTLGRSAIVRKPHLPLILNTSVIRFRPIKNRSSFSLICGYLNSSLFLDEMRILK